MPLTLTSPDFEDEGDIPVRCTCEGENASPAFRWSGVPDGTRELLLTCEDPDAPRGTFRHWAVWGIPAGETGLPAGLGPAADLRQAVNDFGETGYGGPCPPRGDAPHGYVFRLMALDAGLEAPDGADFDEVARQAREREIESVELIGYFGR